MAAQQCLLFHLAGAAEAVLRAKDGALYRQCGNMVPDAWLEAMACYVEVKMDKLNIPVDP